MFNYQWFSRMWRYCTSLFLCDLTGLYNYNVLIAVGFVIIIDRRYLMFIGTSKVIKTIIRAVLPILIARYRILFFQNIRLDKGPKIVVIGGGTGLSNLLHGLKTHTSNLSAIVTVADDGGSSGRLRQDFKMIAPGDLRNCLIALAEQEGVMEICSVIALKGKMSYLGIVLVTSLSQHLPGIWWRCGRKRLKRLVNCCVYEVV